MPASACTTGSLLLSGSATSFTHTGLTSGTTYYYRVCASDKAGNSSTGARTRATPGSTRPAGSLKINGGAASTLSTAVTLTLSATDDVGVTGYYLSTSSSPPAATALGWVPVSSTPSYAASRAYTVSSGDGTKTLYAWYKDGAGNVSATASASILVDQTAPTNGSATAIAAGFADTGSGLAGAPYKLVFATGAMPASACSTGSLLLSGSATSFTHTGLTNGTTYYYRVCASDKAGNTSTGAKTSAIPAGTPNTPPTGSLKINGGAAYTLSTAVTLTLSATDDTGVTGYYVSTSSTPPTASATGWTTVTSTTSYAGTLPYTLATGDGTKTLYAW
ncbi:MAG: hypothetical protein DMD83_15725, partial [Candidatus Rokuibacteriota bacterium]